MNYRLRDPASSPYRRKFKLSARDLSYAQEHGLAEVLDHARDMLEKRLFAAEPARDGKQTPYRGHPVFTAQHATATCCRSCLEKWHGIPKGVPLSETDRDYVLTVIGEWVQGEMEGSE